MNTNLIQLEEKRTICKAEIKEKQKELHRLTNAIAQARYREKKKKVVI